MRMKAYSRGDGRTENTWYWYIKCDLTIWIWNETLCITISGGESWRKSGIHKTSSPDYTPLPWGPSWGSPWGPGLLSTSKTPFLCCSLMSWAMDGSPGCLFWPIWLFEAGLRTSLKEKDMSAQKKCTQVIDSLIPPCKCLPEPCRVRIFFKHCNNHFVKMLVIEGPVKLHPCILLCENKVRLNITSCEHVRYMIQTQDLLGQLHKQSIEKSPV